MSELVFIWEAALLEGFNLAANGFRLQLDQADRPAHASAKEKGFDSPVGESSSEWFQKLVVVSPRSFGIFRFNFRCSIASKMVVDAKKLTWRFALMAEG